MTVSFTRAGAGYALHAVGGCFAETVPVRLETVKGLSGSRLATTGAAQDDGCRSGWAYSFLRGDLQIGDGGGSSGVIDVQQGADTLVDFAYVGTRGTLASRNDMRCVPAHVTPFTCGTYRSTSGTGSLAFLGSDRYALSFEHENGVLTATFMGRCNALSRTFEVAGSEIVAFDGGSTLEGCDGPAGAEDIAVTRFFTGVLTCRIDGGRVTFRKGAATAVFER